MNVEDAWESACKGRAVQCVYPKPPGPGPWTLKECASTLAMSAETLRAAVQAGELAAILIRRPRKGGRRHWRVTAAAWQDYLRKTNGEA